MYNTPPTWLPIIANPLPDETLCSVIGRSFILSRGNSSGSFLEKTFGTKHAVVATGMPSRISVLTERLQQNSIDICANDIINNNTLYPYFSAFLSPLYAKLLRHKMLSSDGRSMKIGSGLVAHGLGAAEPLRQCNSCRNDDFEKYGQPFWHRSHQLPGVCVCYLHEEPLFEVRGPAHNSARHLLMLPSNTNPPPQINYRSNRSVVPHVTNHLSHELARWSHLLLFTQLVPRPLVFLRDLYVRRLIDLGFSSQNGRIRQKELSDYILNYHINFNYLNDSTDLAHLTSGVLSWVAKLVRKPKAAHHPLQHILFAMTIFDNWNTYLAAFNFSKPIRKKNNTPNKEDKTRQMIFNLIEENKFSLRKTALHVGLSVTTVGIIANQLGLKISVRPKHIDTAKVQSTLEQLAQGVPVFNIAQELQLSEVSIRRILRTHSETAKLRVKVLYSKEFTLRQEQLVNKINELHLKDRQSIRQLCQKEITWFRRHDINWLNQFIAHYKPTNSSPHPRVDWIQRDRKLLDELIITRKAILSKPGKPIKVTKTELGRRMGRLDWLDKHLNKLPSCNLYITNIVESRSDFRLRRINWAVKELHAQGMPIVGWRIRRVAGIGKNEEPAVSIYINSMCDIRFSSIKYA